MADDAITICQGFMTLQSRYEVWIINEQAAWVMIHEWILKYPN